MLSTFLICFGCFLLACILSTASIRLGLPLLADARPKPAQKSLPFDPPQDTPEDPAQEPPLRSVGFWIGVCETFLIFVFVFFNSFSALAIVMGAKEFIRKEKIAENPAYYLLGTLLNFSIALGFAVLARALTERAAAP